METEELTKLVDGIYKNILDKFNPGARQMITAGKAYLKALHGAAAASRLYVEAITKLGRQAQQGTWGGSADIGTALMKVVEVYREIQEQQMNILKAFYVDLLVPLETNLEKDTKVVQSEQKRFLQQHKLRSESYSKAAAAMKRQRKKNTKSTKTSGMAMDKELKNMQILEEEKTKLDAFCEQSLKNAMTQERRRYGFVLERQCSLARHWMAYHVAGAAAYRNAIEDWQEAARSREGLPPAVDAMFISKMRQVSFWADEDVYASPGGRGGGDRGAVSADELERLSVSSQLRKTRSMDASCLDVRSLDRAASPSPVHLSRAKSDFNINSSTHSLEDGEFIESLNATPTRRPRSMALPPSHRPPWQQPPMPPHAAPQLAAPPPLARALYAYLSSGDNQLSFLEGDVLALLGERTKGWQYGENLRTQLTGWFPLAYTETIETEVGSPNRWGIIQPPVIPSTPGSAPGSPASSGRSGSQGPPAAAPPSGAPATPAPRVQPDPPHQLQTRMFGDTLLAHRSSKQIRRVTASNSAKQANHGPAPTLPAPVPTPTVPSSLPSQNSSSQQVQKKITQSQSATFQSSMPSQPNKSATMKNSTSSASGFPSVPDPKSFGPQTLPARVQGQAARAIPKGVAPVGNVSLHSSNDSGFSNEPPPQPEVDYSDDENAPRHRIPIRGGQDRPRRYTEGQSNGHSQTQTLQRERPRPMENGNGQIYGSNTNGRNSYLTDDQQIILRSMIEDKEGTKVKRTKSFWKFGRTTSEDILEGMALWKHRDLVDIVPQYKRKMYTDIDNMNIPIEYQPNIINMNMNIKNMSEGSDTTLKRNMPKVSVDENKTLDRLEKYKMQKSKSSNAIVSLVKNEKKPQSGGENRIEAKNIKSIKPSPQQIMDDEYNSRNERQSNNSDLTNSSTIKTNFENSFYDDESGEGLVVKTVKRKEILQQYNDTESVSGSETERNSIASSTDPYDCIIVDDHMTLRKQRELENRRLQAQQSQYNTKASEKSRDRTAYMSEISDSDNNGPIKPHLRATLSSERQKTSSKSQVDHAPQRMSTFKTFKDNESELKMYSDSNETLKYSEHSRKEDKYYQNHETDSKKAAKSKKYYDQKEEIQQQQRSRHYSEHSNTNGKHNQSYYAEQSDDHKYNESSEQQKPQLLPRTKLLKANNVGPTMQTVMKFEQEIGLMEYRSPPRDRSKGHDNSEFAPPPGHTYGPWFDLWGREQSPRK